MSGKGATRTKLEAMSNAVGKLCATYSAEMISSLSIGSSCKVQKPIISNNPATRL